MGYPPSANHQERLRSKRPFSRVVIVREYSRSGICFSLWQRVFWWPLALFVILSSPRVRVKTDISVLNKTVTDWRIFVIGRHRLSLSDLPSCRVSDYFHVPTIMENHYSLSPLLKSSALCGYSGLQFPIFELR